MTTLFYGRLVGFTNASQLDNDTLKLICLDRYIDARTVSGLWRLLTDALLREAFSSGRPGCSSFHIPC